MDELAAFPGVQASAASGQVRRASGSRRRAERTVALRGDDTHAAAQRARGNAGALVGKRLAKISAGDGSALSRLTSVFVERRRLCRDQRRGAQGSPSAVSG
jgi:hypothetical protein